MLKTILKTRQLWHINCLYYTGKTIFKRNTISSGGTWKGNFSIRSMAEKLPKYILIVDDGYSQLLLMDISEDNPAYNNIKIIKEEIERMREITKKLMGITRYETKDYIEGRKIIDIDKATI